MSSEDSRWQQRPEAERLLERLTHLRTGDGDLTPEAQTLLLEIIARMTLSLDDRGAEVQAVMATAAQGIVATMRAALPFIRELLAALSDQHSDPEPTQTPDDTSYPDTLAALVQGTHQAAGVMRIHVGPSGHPQYVEPGEVVQARPLNLIPGDVVTNLHEYPHGFSPRLYLGHFSHPLLPDTESLVWWTDGGPALSHRVGRMDVIGIVLPAVDAERQVRLKRWTEAMD